MGSFRSWSDLFLTTAQEQKNNERVQGGSSEGEGISPLCMRLKYQASGAHSSTPSMANGHETRNREVPSPRTPSCSRIKFEQLERRVGLHLGDSILRDQVSASDPSLVR